MILLNWRHTRLKAYNNFQSPLRLLMNAFPGLRALGKNSYYRASYLFFSKRGFKYALHPKVKLLTPSQWLGLDQVDTGELFFGYYDKSPWSNDMQRLLFHQPYSGNRVQIVLYNRYTSETKSIATSYAWNYQQGSMTQWLSGGNTNEIIFNNFVEGNLVAHIVTPHDGITRTIPWPIQVVHPNGQEALTLNYRRLDKLRPDYGYRVSARNFNIDQALDRDGIWWINLHNGEGELRLTLAQLIKLSPRVEMQNAWHKVNHLYYAPDGRHFVFMHRWFSAHGKFSRLYLANSNVSNLRLLLDDRTVSHYSWKDEDHVIVWAYTREKGDHYYLINIHSGNKQIIGENVLDIYGDGHPTFSPDQRWIVTDSYPNKARQRHLLLFNYDTSELIELGRFFAPWQFKGVQRCDLHPRWSPDGRYISIDSAHEGIRKSYILDVCALVEHPA